MSEEEYLTLPSGTVWELGGEYDPTDFFRALTLFVNQGSILYIESTSIDRALLEMLTKYASTMSRPIKPGTIWPKGKQMHLSLSKGLIGELGKISETHPVPDYADHVLLYSNDVIVEAYDLGESPFYISGSLPESLVKQFAEISKTVYRRITI